MRGAVYYAVRSARYVEMALRSARSLKRYMPDLPVTLFTDLPDCAITQRGVFQRTFKVVEQLPPVSKLLCHNVMSAMAAFPYKISLFVDTDVWVCGDLSEIFDAIEHSPLDLMLPMVQQYRYIHRLNSIYEKAGVPDAYPRYATGIVGIEKNSRTAAFVKRWADRYRELCEEWTMSTTCSDQVPLRIALHQSPDVRVGALRDCYDYQLYGYFNRPVKAIHTKGKEKQFQEWEREVNRHPRAPRYFAAGKCIHWIKQ